MKLHISDDEQYATMVLRGHVNV